MTDLSRMYFNALSQAEQEAAIRRLAATGMGESTIAFATGLSVEQIRRGGAQRLVEARIGQLLGESRRGSHHSVTTEGREVDKDDRQDFRILARALDDSRRSYAVRSAPWPRPTPLSPTGSVSSPRGVAVHVRLARVLGMTRGDTP